MMFRSQKIQRQFQVIAGKEYPKVTEFEDAIETSKKDLKAGMSLSDVLNPERYPNLDKEGVKRLEILRAKSIFENNFSDKTENEIMQENLEIAKIEDVIDFYVETIESMKDTLKTVMSGNGISDADINSIMQNTGIDNIEEKLEENPLSAYDIITNIGSLIEIEQDEIDEFNEDLEFELEWAQDSTSEGGEKITREELNDIFQEAKDNGFSIDWNNRDGFLFTAIGKDKDKIISPFKEYEVTFEDDVLENGGLIMGALNSATVKMDKLIESLENDSYNLLKFKVKKLLLESSDGIEGEGVKKEILKLSDEIHGANARVLSMKGGDFAGKSYVILNDYIDEEDDLGRNLELTDDDAAILILDNKGQIHEINPTKAQIKARGDRQNTEKSYKQLIEEHMKNNAKLFVSVDTGINSILESLELLKLEDVRVAGGELTPDSLPSHSTAEYNPNNQPSKSERGVC